MLLGHSHLRGYVTPFFVNVDLIPIEVIGGLLMLAGVFPALYLTQYFIELKDNISVLWLIILSFILVIRSMTEGLMVMSDSPQLTGVLLYFSRILGIIGVTFVLFFVLEYSIGRTLSTRTLAIISLVPTLLIGKILITPNEVIEVTMPHNGIPVWEYTGGWGTLVVGMVTLYLLIPITILLRDSLVTSGTKHKQVIILVGALITGAVVAYIQIAGFSPYYFNPIIYGYILSLTIVMAGINRYGLFSTYSIGRQAVFERVDDGIMTVQDGGSVVDCNMKGKKICELGSLEDSTYEDVIATHPELEEIFNTEKSVATITNSNRVYQVTSSNLSFGRGHTGIVLHFQDITDRRRREQRLDTVRQIFSRVFRHNISNKLTVIMGNTSVLKNNIATDGGQVEESVRAIEDSTEKLLTHAEKARQLERLIASSTTPAEVDVTNVITNQIDAIKEDHPNILINTHICENAKIKAHPQFHLFVKNGIENAITHNTDPTINITVTRNQDEGTATIQIEDDGCGIPEVEQEALEKGEENPLTHSSGIGLWLMKWIVEESDGEFLISSNEHGTVITGVFNLAMEG